LAFPTGLFEIAIGIWLIAAGAGLWLVFSRSKDAHGSRLEVAQRRIPDVGGA
jgi:hypothetical protein